MADRWASGRTSAQVNGEVIPLYRSFEGALAQGWRRARAVPEHVAQVWRCGADRLWAITADGQALPVGFVLEAVIKYVHRADGAEQLTTAVVHTREQDDRSLGNT